MKAILIFLVLLSVMSTAHAAVHRCVDPDKGNFTVLVGTGGFFGAFAHDHTIEAKSISGCAELDTDQPERSSVMLTFPASGLKVIDPHASATDRAKVQAQMENEVLRVQEFPTIHFESQTIQRSSKPNSFIVKGSLTIRGQSQPAAIPVDLQKLEGDTFRVTGEYTFRQTAFGIKPIQLMAGTVRVKDEVKIRFDLPLK